MTQLKIDNQGVYFTDGTYLQTAAVAWTSVSGRPSDLNQLPNASGFINAISNCGSNCQNNCIGFVYPSITNVAGNFSQYSYYASTLDNGNIQLAYPTNQNITVKFTNVDLSTAPTLFNDYSLQLYFTPIITDQEAINNAALLSGKF